MAKRLKSDTATPENPRIAELRKEYRDASPQDRAAILEEIQGLKDKELSTSKDDFADTTDSTKPMKPSKDAQIHEAAQDFKPKDLINRSNMDGSGVFVSDRASGNQALDNLANELLGSRPKAAQALGTKLKGLIEPSTHNAMSKGDKAKLDSVLAGEGEGMRKKPSEIAEIVNQLAEKYASVDKTPTKVTKLEGYDKNGKVTPDLAKEDTPNPKAVAAKKAALLERAASGDEALVKELGTSTDAKGLQRAIGALADHAPDSEAMKTATARLTELMKDPDVAYGLGTKKYSLESNDGHPNDKLGRLVTRLASNKREQFIHVRTEGVAHGKVGTDSFGVFGRDVTHFFFRDGDYTHTAVVPDQFVARLKQALKGVDPDKRANALQYFAIQHGMYHEGRGTFDTFGPRRDSPAGKLAEARGVLGDTKTDDGAGGKMTRIEGVSNKDTVDFLATALAYSKHVLGKDELPVNWERVTGANKGKTGSGIFSAEATDPNVNNAASPRPDIKDHIEKVLGKSVRLAWAKFTHAGEYVHAVGQGIIRLSVHALDPMSTAYHESLHAFFGQMRDAGAHDITGVLEKAASSAHVLEQLREIYKAQPEVLKQLRDPEERAAYMYQQWALDPKGFKIALSAKGTFGKIAAFIREAMGVWTNDERALHIMDYFHSGEYAKDMGRPSAVRGATMAVHRNAIHETAMSFTEPLARMADAVGSMGSARMHDTGIPALSRLADLIKRDHLDASGKDQGFIQATRVQATQRRGKLADALSQYSEDHLNAAMESLQSNTPAATPEARLAAREVKKFLAES